MFLSKPRHLIERAGLNQWTLFISSVAYIYMQMSEGSAALGNKTNKWFNGVFWDVTPCGSCKNRRFGGT
jgi:hypothetical protein